MAPYRYFRRTMPDIDYIRVEIERMRLQVVSAEALLQRMLDKIDGLCTERDRMKAELPKPRKVLGGRKW